MLNYNSIYNIHHIKESFHPSFNQGLHKLLVQRRIGGGGGGGEHSLLATLSITGLSSFATPLSRSNMTISTAYLLVNNMTKPSPLAPLQCINSQWIVLALFHRMVLSNQN